ncbi:MAG: TonB family protein [Desulfovibrionaceae bacterium]|nr:TonB family protein [Desulfovibrionaceae bacterium]
MFDCRKARCAPIVFLLACILGLLSEQTYAQTQGIAIDDDNGYAGRVIEKVMQKWSPPQVRGTHTVLVKVLLDGSGAVSACTPLKRSSLDAFDNVACSAIRKAAPFGRTSYEAPLTIYLTFRTGSQESKESLTEIEKLRAELKEKNRLENERASAQAAANEERSRAKAQAVAKERGEALPKIKPQPIAQSEPKERVSAKQKPAKKEQTLHSYGESERDIKDMRAKAELPVLSSNTDLRVQKYTDLLHNSLNRVLVLPKNAQRSSYSMRVRMSVDAKGRLSNVQVLESSGDEAIDAALVRCVLQARTVPAPPKGIGQTFSVPLTATKKNP